MFLKESLNSRLTAFVLVILSASFALSTSEPHLNTVQSKIPVNIHIHKPVEYLNDKTYVLTGINLTAEAEIGDDKFKNLTYKWSTKNGTLNTDPKESKIVFSFKDPDPQNFLKLTVSSANNETGTKQKDLVVKDPVVIADPKGKLFLEQGQLLQVDWKLSGTGPFMHCIEICLVTDPNDCKCTKAFEPTPAEASYLHYIREVGNYTLLFIVHNIASQVEKRYKVKINGTIRNVTVPYVPIVCSIIAVLILVSGFALHRKFRNTIDTETANFDFIRTYQEAEDEWFEELSFWERVRYVLFGPGPEDQESIMNRSHLT